MLITSFWVSFIEIYAFLRILRVWGNFATAPPCSNRQFQYPGSNRVKNLKFLMHSDNWVVAVFELKSSKCLVKCKRLQNWNNHLDYLRTIQTHSHFKNASYERKLEGYTSSALKLTKHGLNEMHLTLSDLRPCIALTSLCLPTVILNCSSTLQIWPTLQACNAYLRQSLTSTSHSLCL